MMIKKKDFEIPACDYDGNLDAKKKKKRFSVEEFKLKTQS